MPTSWVRVDGRDETLFLFSLGNSWDGSQASALAVGAQRWDDIAHCTRDIARSTHVNLLVSLSLYLDNDRSVLRPLFTPQEEWGIRNFFFLQRGKEVGDHFLQHKINDTPCSCRHVLWSDKLMWCLSTNRPGLPITAARPNHTCEHCKWMQGFFSKRKGIRADGYVDWIKVKLKINPPLIEVTTNCSGHQHAWWVEATPENQS